MIDNSVICALATSQVASAISLIRISGEDSFKVVNKIIKFKNKDKKFNKIDGFTIHRADIYDNKILIDDALISVFKKPYSYTGENMIEISCHGSTYIQQKFLELLTKNGARLANAGEFTLRAFINGKIDLSQAEAIADLISSTNTASHDIAINHLRGGFKNELSVLREKLLNLASLIELELDFSEEDVEFADRKNLLQIINELITKVSYLKNSFELGNAIKNGILITIAGNTNVGKSTLLNAILNEEKAIVSNIHGTTRDVIEDIIVYNGINFRFADTAGIRASKDKIEKIGISRSLAQIKRAKVILLMVDTLTPQKQIEKIYKSVFSKLTSSQSIILLLNKSDLCKLNEKISLENFCKKLIKPTDSFITISAKKKINIGIILKEIYKKVVKTHILSDNVIITNTRHFEALSKAEETLNQIKIGMKNNIQSDLLVQDLKEALYYIGNITGEITNNEILNNIFKNFCIGK
ncbi:MAG: tRNA uridine-5-carboxymethylaminomethyl(34) synthesis GTPase MnmE [Bacteroidetes bacterium GWA2_32_17]|nr:MAG: tRNA uridine-5-carboxymethylaminomethyl(34) synthesis GTPase MnmE [Bacteroidetes bacterium GWA2_32_17]